MNTKILCFKKLFFIFLLLFPLPLYASFIEATMGTAVVNDATATYYNPSALTLLKNPQLVTLGSVANLRTQFDGQFTTQAGLSQTGSSSTSTHYYLPSLYLAFPLPHKFFIGFALVGNDFNRDIEQNSILRYAQSSNSVENLDFVPAIGIQITDYLSVGAGVNFSYAKFILEPIVGVPGLNVPDSQSHNESSGTSLSGDVGLLFKPSKKTLIGFDYRSASTYQLNGKSVLEGNPDLISPNYHFTFWTPAKSVFSISHFLSEKFGVIGTVQYIQWNIFDEGHVHNVATRVGMRQIIIPDATVQYHYHNAWVFTLGSNYRLTSKWILRAAATYLQSPSSGQYQLSNGDSIVVGGSAAYEISKYFLIDGSYAHAFMKNQQINIADRNRITGINKGARDAISLKLTINFV